MRGLMFFLLLVLSPLSLTRGAMAEGPRVVTDIAPVQSLVAAIMQGVGEPDVLIEAGTSPHGTSLRPSAARALSRADLLVWIGPDLTLWLEDARTSLASQAVNLPLMQVDGTVLLPVRDAPVFELHGEPGEDHDHDHDHDHDQDHGHDQGHDHEHDHAAALSDPHVWLDPQNARVWVPAIADALAKLDPEHTETYRKNAAQLEADLAALEQELAAQLDPLKGVRYLVYHDAFQYFAARFDLPESAAIQARDAQTPGAARIFDLRAALSQNPVDCAITEPQLAPRLIATVAGSETKVIELDPLGTAIAPGPAHYSATLRAMAKALAGCTAR